MRLLVLERHPQFGGGSEAMSLELANALAARGHEMYLAFEHEGSMLSAYRRVVREAWQAPLPLFGWRRIGAALACVRRLGSFCRSRNIDALLTSQLGYLRTLALLDVVYGMPSLCHLGLPLIDPPRSVRWAMRRIAAGVSPSAHTAAVWREQGWPSERLHVVPNWIDVERFAPCDDRLALRRSLGLDSSAPLAVYVGRIVREKGVETLLRAFAVVLRALPTATLVLAGSPSPEYASQFDRLQGELQLNEERIRRVGAVDHPEQYLAAADVAVVPSEWNEPFGLVVLEAMACGAVTVTSDVGVLPKILGSTNADMVFPAGDVEALASRLVHWLAHRDEDRVRGRRLRERVVSEFGRERSVDVYEKILRQVANSP